MPSFMPEFSLVLAVGLCRIQRRQAHLSPALPASQRQQYTLSRIPAVRAASSVPHAVYVYPRLPMCKFAGRCSCNWAQRSDHRCVSTPYLIPLHRSLLWPRLSSRGCPKKPTTFAQHPPMLDGGPAPRCEMLFAPPCPHAAAINGTAVRPGALHSR